MFWGAGGFWLGEDSILHAPPSVSSGRQVRGGTKEAAPGLPAQRHEQGHPDGPRVRRQPQEGDPGPADALLRVSTIRVLLSPAVVGQRSVSVSRTPWGPGVTQEPGEVPAGGRGPQRVGPRGLTKERVCQ